MDRASLKLGQEGGPEPGLEGLCPQGTPSPNTYLGCLLQALAN